MIEHRLTLDYTLQPGWMAPFVDGLLAGKACARRCKECTRTSFPPLRICPCGSDGGNWVTLSGDAQILFRTDGADGAFGLVQFSGAQTHSIARLDGILAQHHSGILGKPIGDLPMIRLIPSPSEITR